MSRRGAAHPQRWERQAPPRALPPPAALSIGARPADLDRALAHRRHARHRAPAAGPVVRRRRRRSLPRPPRPRIAAARCSGAHARGCTFDSASCTIRSAATSTAAGSVRHIGGASNGRAGRSRQAVKRSTQSRIAPTSPSWSSVGGRSSKRAGGCRRSRAGTARASRPVALDGGGSRSSRLRAASSVIGSRRAKDQGCRGGRAGGSAAPPRGSATSCSRARCRPAESSTAWTVSAT